MKVEMEKLRKDLWVFEIQYRTYFFKLTGSYSNRKGTLWLTSDLQCEVLNKNVSIADARECIAKTEEKRFPWATAQ